MILFKNKTIAVVSNSPNLLGLGLGQEIDCCDLVARFNHFSIYGHEKDVGKKTDVYVAYYGGCKPKEDIAKMNPKACFLCYNCDELPPDQMCYLGRPAYLMSNGFLRPRVFSTTGLTFIHWLLDNTQPKEIQLFGFGVASDGHYFNLDHAMTEHHDAKLEASIIRNLACNASTRLWLR